MSFELSSHRDKNKIFLVYKRDLEGRIDPNTYHPHRKKAKNRIVSSLFPSEKLGFLSSFSKKIVGSISDTDIYIGLENIESNTGKFIESSQKENISSAVIFKKRQVLFPKLRPYLNKVFYANFDGICSTEFHILDSDKLENKYLSIFLSLDVVVSQTTLLMSGNTLPRLQTEDIKNLLIPIPPKKLQTEVIVKMDRAYASKKQKEAEAQQLLDSIDGYLLGKLGVKLAKQEENTIESRIFTRRLSEVSGGRFDAPIHHKQYALNSTIYPMGKFKDCLSINPLISFYGFSSDTLATFIPMENVSDQYGDADISECRAIDESGGYTKFQDNDLLWAKITPCMQNGKSVVVSGLESGIGFGSTEFHIFRPKNNINIRYIHGLLRLRSLRAYAILYFSGSAGHQRVADNFFKKLNIPKPPIEVQTEIANQITQIRNKAKQLRQQAKAELEQAKKEVEAMVLGEKN